MRAKNLRAAARQSLQNARAPGTLTFYFLLCLYGTHLLLLGLDFFAERSIGSGLRAARAWDIYWSVSYFLSFAFTIASALWSAHYDNYYAIRLSRGQETGFKHCFLAPFHHAGHGFLTIFLSRLYLSLWALLFLIPGMIALSYCSASIALTADAAELLQHPEALLQAVTQHPLFPAALALCALAMIPTLVVSYRYRLALYLVYDRGFSAGAAIRESRRLMRGHTAELFRLDLSYCYYYILMFLPSIPLLPENFGITLIPDQYVTLYAIASDVFLFVVCLIWMPQVMTARAHAYNEIVLADQQPLL